MTSWSKLVMIKSFVEQTWLEMGQNYGRGRVIMDKNLRKLLRGALRNRPSTREVSWAHYHINQRLTLQKKLKANTVGRHHRVPPLWHDCDGATMTSERTMITPCLTKARQMEGWAYEFEGVMRAGMAQAKGVSVMINWERLEATSTAHLSMRSWTMWTTRAPDVHPMGVVIASLTGSMMEP